MRARIVAQLERAHKPARIVDVQGFPPTHGGVSCNLPISACDKQECANEKQNGTESANILPRIRYFAHRNPQLLVHEGVREQQRRRAQQRNHTDHANSGQRDKNLPRCRPKELHSRNPLLRCNVRMINFRHALTITFPKWPSEQWLCKPNEQISCQPTSTHLFYIPNFIYPKLTVIPAPSRLIARDEIACANQFELFNELVERQLYNGCLGVKFAWFSNPH